MRPATMTTEPTTTDTTTEQEPAQPALKRIMRQYQPYRVAWYDRAGQLHYQGRTRRAGENAALSNILVWVLGLPRDARPHTVYITGGKRAADVPDQSWFRDLAPGWEITRWFGAPGQLGSDRESHQSQRVTYRHQGVTVDLAMGAAWFGAETDARLCASAYDHLGVMLRGAFDSHASLLSTPARTGMDLLERSLPQLPRDAEGKRRSYPYEPLPPDLQELIRHNFGQGRFEFMRSEGGRLPALYVYDQKWQYASCLHYLPVALPDQGYPLVHDDYCPDYDPHRPGFYRVNAWVPKDWAHVGLIPTWDAEAKRTAWPNTPGLRLQNAWVTGAELAVAADAGWDFAVRERIVFAPSRAKYSDPAGEWIRALRMLRDTAEGYLTEINPDTAPLLVGALRRLVINPVGYWYRPHRATRHLTPYDQAATVPRDALQVLATPQGVEWTEKAPLDAAQASHRRPEWAAMTWGRSRAKWAKQALRAPYSAIVAGRTDALALAERMPDWEAEFRGKPGDWALKLSVVPDPRAGGLIAPRDETAWRRLIGEHIALGDQIGDLDPDDGVAAEG